MVVVLHVEALLVIHRGDNANALVYFLILMATLARHVIEIEYGIH